MANWHCHSQDTFKSLLMPKSYHWTGVAHISPIHKEGDKTKAPNYLSISITSTVDKILKGFVNSAIHKHLTTNKLLSKHQHGF